MKKHVCKKKHSRNQIIQSSFKNMKRLLYITLVCFLCISCDSEKKRSQDFSKVYESNPSSLDLKEVNTRISKIKELEKKGDHLNASEKCSILLTYLAHTNRDSTNRSQALIDTVFKFLFSHEAPEETRKEFTKSAIESCFPANLLVDFPLWKSGAMTPQSAKEFTDDMKTIADGIVNPYIREAIEETNMMKRIRGKLDTLN
jgi:hypothetical protein